MGKKGQIKEMEIVHSDALAIEKVACAGNLSGEDQLLYVFYLFFIYFLFIFYFLFFFGFHS